MSLTGQELGLRLVAGLEGLAGLHADDSVRLATGASLLAAAGRPRLRAGALVAATLAHSLRTLALFFGPDTRRRNERLAVELALSAALGGLLRQAERAARWER